MIFCCKWLSETLFWTYVCCRYVILLLSENYMPQFIAHIISAPPIIGIRISWLAITCGWWLGVMNCQSSGHNDDKHKHNADNTSNSRTTAPTAKIYLANCRQNGNNNSMSIVATTNKQQFVSLSDESWSSISSAVPVHVFSSHEEVWEDHTITIHHLISSHLNANIPSLQQQLRRSPQSQASCPY